MPQRGICQRSRAVIINSVFYQKSTDFSVCRIVYTIGVQLVLCGKRIKFTPLGNSRAAFQV
jgi:hypothetical protein